MEAGKLRLGFLRSKGIDLRLNDKYKYEGDIQVYIVLHCIVVSPAKKHRKEAL